MVLVQNRDIWVRMWNENVCVGKDVNVLARRVLKLQLSLFWWSTYSIECLNASIFSINAKELALDTLGVNGHYLVLKLGKAYQVQTHKNQSTVDSLLTIG